jgi:hypothetical protein
VNRDPQPVPGAVPNELAESKTFEDGAGGGVDVANRLAGAALGDGGSVRLVRSLERASPVGIRLARPFRRTQTMLTTTSPFSMRASVRVPAPCGEAESAPDRHARYSSTSSPG